MRIKAGKFARGSATLGGVLVGLVSASAFAADGTLKVAQGSTNAATPDFNGQVGGGEFGVYEFVITNPALTLLPMSATAKVDPYDFQTFCLEPGVAIDFNATVEWTANVQVQKVDGSFDNLDPRTAYLFFKFWTANAFSPASPDYNYTLGAGRRDSAAALQLALWFTEGESAFNGGNTGLYIDDANDAVAPGGAWFALWGDTFPGNLGGVRALNVFNANPGSTGGVVHPTLQQDLLAVFGEEPPPPPPGEGCEGRTPGFWHNKNGQALIKESGAGAPWTWLETLNDICLVKQNGNDIDFSIDKDGGKDLANFLVSGNNAVNMAQKLSQHVAAMQLNILNGFADSDCHLFTGQNADCLPGSPSTIAVGELLELAKDALCDDKNTPAGDPNRDYQECLKNILEAGNKNTGWVN